MSEEDSKILCLHGPGGDGLEGMFYTMRRRDGDTLWALA